MHGFFCYVGFQRIKMKHNISIKHGIHVNSQMADTHGVKTLAIEARSVNEARVSGNEVILLRSGQALLKVLIIKPQTSIEYISDESTKYLTRCSKKKSSISISLTHIYDTFNYPV